MCWIRGRRSGVTSSLEWVASWANMGCSNIQRSRRLRSNFDRPSVGKKDRPMFVEECTKDSSDSELSGRSFFVSQKSAVVQSILSAQWIDERDATIHRN